MVYIQTYLCTKKRGSKSLLRASLASEAPLDPQDGKPDCLGASKAAFFVLEDRVHRATQGHQKG